MKRALLLVAGLSFTTLAHAEPNPPRRVVVAQFNAPAESRARNAILATLSDHPDVEVISLDDVAFTSKRIQADPTMPAGRRKIATELGVDAWIDGKVDGVDGHFTLTSAEGRHMAEVDVHATTESLLDVLAGEKMWAAMGPRLSEREGRRRALLAQSELARTKLIDREHEVERQRMAARQRAEQRVERLKAEGELARKKQAAIIGELARQEQLVKDRLAQEAQEREQADERRRRAEMRRLALATPVRAPSMGYAQAQPQPRPTQWGSPASSAGGYSARSSGPSAGGYNTPPAASAVAQPAGPGVSSSTQRWLQSQQGSAAPSTASGAAPAQAPGYGAAVPTQAPGYGAAVPAQTPGYGAAAPAQAPGYGAAAPAQAPGYGSAVPAQTPGYAAAAGGVSPATQRWLAQQQQQPPPH
jgi:hypothetical protein